MTGEKPAKKWVGIEKEERRKFYSKVKKNLNLYHLGQSTVYDSIFELIKSLIQRDYPKLDIFDGSEILQIYIPEIWLNQCPRILGKCAVHVIIEVFQLVSNIEIGVKLWMFIYFLLFCLGKFIKN